MRHGRGVSRKARQPRRTLSPAPLACVPDRVKTFLADTLSDFNKYSCSANLPALGWKLEVFNNREKTRPVPLTPPFDIDNSPRLQNGRQGELTYSQRQRARAPKSKRIALGGIIPTGRWQRSTV